MSEKLKLIQAKDYVRRQGKKHGFSVGHPERTPRRDYQQVRNLVTKLERELGVYINSPQAFFDAMFEFREKPDHDRMIQDLETSITRLQTLAEIIKQAKE